MNWLVSTTYGHNYDELASIVTPNHLGYCRKHGYDYNVHHAPFNSKNVYYNGNINLIYSMLPYYDAIMLIDLDLIFMDWEIDLDRIFPSKYNQLIAEENLSPGGSPLNAGVVLFRNSKSSMSLLRAFLDEKPSYENHCQVWQKQICDYVEEKNELVKEMGVVSSHVMNSRPIQETPPSYKEGDFIVHAYCMNIQDKIDNINKFLSKVKYE